MSAATAAPLQARAARPAPPGIAAGGGLRLQRKCACGAERSPLAPQCGECASKTLLGRMLQAKLRVNEPGDAYEREADEVAQAVMGQMPQSAGPSSAPRAARTKKPAMPAESDLVRGGAPLAADVAAFYEARFGRDFSAVRIHADDTAADYNEAVDAFAFTFGNHVWLGPRVQHRASHILAHELAHVVQQTQPPPLAAAPAHPSKLGASPQRVQRYEPYWMPAEFIARDRNAKKKVGTGTHKLVLPLIGKENGIHTEAPVPNADTKSGVSLGVTGIADLYRATTTVGVFFDGQSLPRELGSNPELRHAGERLERNGHIDKSAPRADEARQSVVRAGQAPTDIAVGDLKPSHGTVEASGGPQQVKDYLGGFRLARDEVNKLSVGTGGTHQTDARWNPLTTHALAVAIPDQLKASTHGQGQKSRALVQVHNGRVVDAPRPAVGKRPAFVMGKVYVTESPDKGGIYNYVWEPDTLAQAAGPPASVTDMGTEVESKLVAPLMASPVKTARKSRPAAALANRAALRHGIQKKPLEEAPAEVKDPFDQASFEQWKSDHRELTEKEAVLEKTPEFGDAESRTLAVRDREAAIRSGFQFPAISKGEQAGVKTIGKIRFWTGASSAIFGRLRYWFGGLFVKVVNAYHAIRARFQGLLKDRQNTPKKGGLLGTVIRIAFEVLKAAGRFMVTRTAQHLVDSLKQGVARKLKSLIPEDRIEEFEAKVKEVTDFAEDLERRAVATVEAFVQKTVGPYLGYIETLSDVADKLSEVTSVVSKVRWGARVLACLSPPGWGCLWILAQSVIEKFASWLVDSCWFKKEIAPLVTAVEFIASLPKRLAQFIIDGIRSFLPDSLSDVFADVDAEKISTDVPAAEICDKNDFPPPLRDRAMVERLALAELRKDIGEDKWEAWTRMATLYGVNRGDFLSEAEVADLKKQLAHARVEDLRQAADLYPTLAATTTGKDVVNLTAFLERAAQVKAEMEAGTGAQPRQDGQGDDGEGGISVSASKEATAGNYKPTRLGFEVVGGVTRGQYQGDVVKVDRAATIKGTVVTLEGVEVVVRKRELLPSPVHPDKLVIRLEVTRDQVFDIESEYGADVVRKIGYKRFQYKKGVQFSATLPLTSGAAAAAPRNPPRRREPAP